MGPGPLGPWAQAMPEHMDIGGLWGPFGAHFGAHLESILGPIWDPCWDPFGTHFGTHFGPHFAAHFGLHLPYWPYRPRQGIDPYPEARVMEESLTL